MIGWLPFIIILTFAGIGAAARYGSVYPLPLRNQTAVLGGWAIGVLMIWIPACLLRAFVIGIMSESVSFVDAILFAVPLFFFEGLVILAAIVRQMMYLKGDFDHESEWKPSMVEGRSFMGWFLFLSCVLFFPAWNFLSPGEYGVYRGSLADNFVTQPVLDLFANPESSEVSLESVQDSEESASLPASFALANIWALALYLIRPVKRFLLGELSREDYVYEDRVSGPSRPNYGPRGGGRN